MIRKGRLPKLTLTHSDNDWQGLYIDGKLVLANHSLHVNHVLEALEALEALGIVNLDGYILTKEEEKHLDDIGCLPQLLDEFDDGSWLKR